jgi:hypothetical protein
MRFFAMHRKNGDIVALASCQPDAPPVAVIDDPELIVTEIELPDGAIDLEGAAGDPESEQRVLQTLQKLRDEGTLVIRTPRGTT